MTPTYDQLEAKVVEYERWALSLHRALASCQTLTKFQALARLYATLTTQPSPLQR